MLKNGTMIGKECKYSKDGLNYYFSSTYMRTVKSNKRGMVVGDSNRGGDYWIVIWSGTTTKRRHSKPLIEIIK